MGRVPPVLKKANCGGRREARLRSTSGSLLTPMSEVQARVTIGKPFAVGKYAVTFDEWDACVGDGGCKGYKLGDEGWGWASTPSSTSTGMKHHGTLGKQLRKARARVSQLFDQRRNIPKRVEIRDLNEQ